MNQIAAEPLPEEPVDINQALAGTNANRNQANFLRDMVDAHNEEPN